MKYDRDLINSRIEQVQDPIQKILLEDVLKDVFSGILDYTEERFGELERKVKGEFETTPESFDLYTGVCRQEERDEESRFLFEMKAGGMEDAPHTLRTVYLSCEFPAIRWCLKQTFHAEVVTERDTYDIKIKLRYSQKYQSTIEWLYRQFQCNGMEWRTVNCPYLFKFLDVVDVEHAIPEGERVRRLGLSLGDLDPFLYMDMVPVWNVEEIHVNPKIEAVPGENVVQYEHTATLPRSGEGYLAVLDESDNGYMVRNKDTLMVRTEMKSYESLKLLRFAPYRPDKDNTEWAEPLQTNCRKLRNLDKQAIRRSKFLFTRGEIERILSSYAAYRTVRLEDVRVEEPANRKMIDYNHFIPSHTFLNNRREMVFTFRALEKEDRMLYETMFFLLSELQLQFDEYKCVGEIKVVTSKTSR